MIQLRLLGHIDLRDGSDAEVRRILAQPKRLALLAYLAIANGQYRRRDTILTQFWPELDMQRGRNALRQALHHLRKELGADAILARNQEELGINSELVWCDVTAFKERLGREDDAGAVELYRGDLMAGLHFAEAPPEWDSWIESERLKLRTAAAAAAWRLSDKAVAAQKAGEARKWAQRAFEIVGDEASFRAYATRVMRTGDAIGVRRAFEAFTRRLEREFEIQPSAETRQYIETLLATPVEGSSGPWDIGSGRSDSGPDDKSRVPHSRKLRRYIVGATTAMVLALASVAWWRNANDAGPRVLAVGAIRDLAESPTVASALSELMTTELARAGGSRVISTPRLYEVAIQIDSAAPLSVLPRAAVASGADEYVEGALYRNTGELRLDLRRVELRSGRVLAAYTVTGPDAYTLTERATGRLLADLGLQPASGRLADVTTRSVVALRFYQEGLRARLQDDESGARRFFSAAVAEDSAFAMATFELSRLQLDNQQLRVRSAQLANQASDRERLIIQAYHAHDEDSPSRLAIAETLAVRYPTEPEGLLLLGKAQVAAAQFVEAARTLRRVVQMDTLSLRGTTMKCRACDAYWDLVSAWVYADSMRRAEQVGREFAEVLPGRAAPWGALATVLEHTNRIDEAVDAVAKYEQLAQKSLGEYHARTLFLVKQGRFPEAEGYIERIYQSATHREDKENALWAEFILLRNMGRFREALMLADSFRTFNAAAPRGERYWTAQARQIALFDLGRYDQAAALSDSAAMYPFGNTSSRQARSIAGNLVFKLNNRAAQNDTAGVRVLADSIARIAPHSGFARDQRYTYYARGVYLRMLGRHQEAVEQLQKSLYSPLGGYVRANLELGRELLAVGRAREALYYLDAGMRGPLGASGLYSIQPELRSWRARAREALGDRAGALEDYERVVRDLARADPEAKPLRDYALGRARALGSNVKS